MDQIALIIGGVNIYWSTAIIALAAGAGVLFFWCFYLWNGEDYLGAFLTAPVSVVLGVVLARLVHWYCRTDSYVSLRSAMTDYSYGGFALAGAFAGCLLAALLLRLTRLVKNLPALLDSMSLGGCGAIALGRLSGFCNSLDRGQLLTPGQGGFWAATAVNTATGAVEYRLATFLLQAMAAGVLFIGLSSLFLWKKKKLTLRDGDITLLFLLYYSASQVVLDSTRYDAIYFRSNGFVSVVQILCACAIVMTIAVFSVRYWKAGGWRPGCAALWLACAALIGGAGYMEYYVQRHGNQAVFAYSVMSGCLTGVLVLTTALWAVTRRREVLRSMPTIYPSLSDAE